MLYLGQNVLIQLFGHNYSPNFDLGPYGQTVDVIYLTLNHIIGRV